MQLTHALLFAFAASLAACGGDDAPGSDAGSGQDASGTSDASPTGDAAAGGPHFDVPEGRFQILERHFPGGGSVARLDGAVATMPWTGFHAVAAEEGACRLLTHDQGFCEACEGICSDDGTCIPWPEYLSAGDVEVAGLNGAVEVTHDQGRYYATGLESDLFDDDAEVALSAAGDEVAAFSLTTGAVGTISPELAGTESDELRLVDGSDLVLSWDQAEPGARVRLTINADNDAHGLPIRAIIECDAADTGSITVPRSLVEAFPVQARTEICVGHDCPTSSLQRYRRATTTVDGLAVELWVGSEADFYAVHEVE